jgi:transposase
MTQAERDRLVALKKVKKKLITEKQAAEEIGVTERQVRRLLRKLPRRGDRAVIHELRGKASNRKLPAAMEQQAMAVLSDPVYRGFGPKLAAEYLRKKHQITVSKETLRQWMTKAGLWKAGPQPPPGNPFEIVTAECDLVTTIHKNHRQDPTAEPGKFYEMFTFRSASRTASL